MRHFLDWGWSLTVTDGICDNSTYTPIAKGYYVTVPLCYDFRIYWFQDVKEIFVWRIGGM